MRSTRSLGLLVALLIALHVQAAKAQPAPPAPAPPALPDLLKKVNELRERLRDLQAKDKASSGSEGAEKRDTKFRLMRYGITAGVSATVYTPGFGGNTLDGIAGGAMPFVGFFPRYWGRNAPKNLYCALEWSASAAAAVSSAANEQTKEQGATNGSPVSQKATKAAEETAQAIGNATETVEAKSKEADALKSSGGKAVPETTVANAAVSTLATSVTAAKKAMDDYEQALKDAKKARDRELDQDFAEQRLDDLEEEEEELSRKLRDVLGDDWHEDKVDALTSAAAAFADPLKCAGEVKKTATYKMLKLKKATTIDHADLACRIAEVRRELVAARKNVGDFKGESTNCTGRKFGFYVGYPGIFSATTMVESRTPRNREERDITPIVSVGFATAPNALAAFTFGPWFGNAEIAQDEHAFVWGLAAGLALTADIFTALAD